jgi:diguanylate cyclase (GGDEF)-like protein/PAS domain S-box-containing protein
LLDTFPTKSTRTQDNGAFLFDINFAIEQKLNPFYSAFIPSIFFSSLEIFLFFPRVMEKNLIAPLTKMITGIEKIKSGEMDVELSPVYDDEIGKISSKLNEILAGFKSNDDKKLSPLDQLSSAFQDNPTATMILASNLKIEFVNSAFCDLTGYTSDEVIGDTPKTIEGGDLFSDLYQEMWLSVFNNRIWRGELKKRHKDGHELWIYSVIKPIENNEGNVSHIVWMMEDFTERRQTEEHLLKLSTIDSLTGISNRRHLFSLSRKAFDYSVRYGNPFSIVLMDIDHFKAVNDTYGHIVGDEVLRLLAHLVGQNIRGADIFGRYGGEEFMITMPNTSLRQAKLAAENLRKLIASRKIAHQEINLSITVSIGIGEWEVKKETFQDIINRADQALYAAKNAGRNRVAG